LSARLNGLNEGQKITYEVSRIADKDAACESQA